MSRVLRDPNDRLFRTLEDITRRLRAQESSPTIQDIVDRLTALEDAYPPLAHLFARASSNLTLGSSPADVPGASISLTAGTWAVTACFDLELNTVNTDTYLVGRLNVGGVDQTDVVVMRVTFGGSIIHRLTLYQQWTVTVGSTTTAKLRADYDATAPAGALAVAGNTNIRAIRVA